MKVGYCENLIQKSKELYVIILTDITELKINYCPIEYHH